MTEYKRGFVSNYCDGQNCDKCVLKTSDWEHIMYKDLGCLAIGNATDGELERAMELILAEREGKDAEALRDDADTVIEIRSSRKIKSIHIEFEEGNGGA